jgi:competence protein ComEC
VTPTRAPLAPLAVALAGGIAASPWTPPWAAWAAWAGALMGGASLAALGRPGPAAAFVLVGFAAAGALRAEPAPPARDHVARLRLPAAVRLEGRLAAEPARLGAERARLLVEVERVGGEPRSGRVPVTVYGPLAPLTQGQHVRIDTRLHRAAGFRNPGVFDYGAWLRRQGILVVGVAGAEEIAALDAPRPPWPVRVRRAAREWIERALPPASAALLEGLLLGDRAGLPAELDDRFRRAGVYHVLAVSGFNVALVGGSVVAALGLARCGRRAAAGGAIAAVVGFALVVGPEPSVLRAVVMAVVVLGAVLLDREASVLNSLALAALILLAARPTDLADPGFQLSFAATLGIVLAPMPRGRLAAALAVSLAAQLAVLPITLVHFNQFSLVGVAANLWVVPLAGAATIVGLLALVVSAVSEAAGAALVAATWPMLLALRWAVALAAAVPGALIHLPAPHWTAVTAYVAALGLALAAWRLRADRPGLARAAGWAAAGLLAAAAVVAAWPLVRPPDGRLRLTVLDVGQGEAIVLEAPDGHVALFDAGPGGPMRLDTGERVVAPFLWNRGVLRLAAAVATHDDQDHAGGLAAVRRLFRVEGEIAADRRHWIGGVSVLALTAHRAGAAAHRGNDRALVLRIDHGVTSFLLTSDMDAAGEAALVASGAPLGATVLKVAHHGSAGSTTAEFLARVRPVVAVISAGARNAYGHPAPATLARLAAAGARVHRTDRHGALLLESDGARLTVTRWATGEVESWCLDPETRCAAR